MKPLGFRSERCQMAEATARIVDEAARFSGDGYSMIASRADPLEAVRSADGALTLKLRWSANRK